ncbi:uncharacterized protein yc1106_07709 [Curvularia clavata]|uniref:DUF6594 domain-containing protein n=1 Tax=Curvularia clavata TaxID=95742 RepID=A0A9Q8ZEW5_CURCL|nr:uncharacterized protein yc1106_07709 [Curvularia clavata]
MARLPHPSGFTARTTSNLSHAYPQNFTNNPEKVEDRRNGYPRLAAFINSDLDFVVFRRFGHLHVRYLLFLQDEIAEMEQKLHTLDMIEPCSFNLNTRRHDGNQERCRILKTLGEKLFDYDKLLEMYYKHVERGPSDPKNVQSVANWMQGNKPLTAEESTFLNSWDDLVSPSEHADHGGLNVLLKRLSHKVYGWASTKVS